MLNVEVVPHSTFKIRYSTFNIPKVSAVECLFAFVALVIIVTIIVGFGAHAQSRADRLNQVYRNLAQRFRGQCIPGGWFSRPAVKFRYGATHTSLSGQPKKRSRPEYTQMLISWPDHYFDMDIFPASRSPFDPEYTEAGDVRLGVGTFPENFVVKTNDEAKAKQFLTEPVQWNIEKLRRVADDDDIHISLHRGRLTIRKSVHLTRFDLLEDFISASLCLYDQAMLTRSIGIEFVTDEAQIIRDASCQICGEEITTDMVFCRRCNTPHHLDCWQYYGGCSVYGCGEKRCVTPRVAEPN